MALEIKNSLTGSYIMSSIDRELVIDDSQVGERFDKVLASVWSDFSRSKIQQWIEAGRVVLNGELLMPKQKAKLGDHCVLSVIPEKCDVWLPEAMPLSIVYEDDSIIVINKSANVVVHPAAGNWSGTLVNGLLHQFPELEILPRAGIVHRLDKDTTGVMVVARTLEAHCSLVAALQARTISREYQALVSTAPARPEFSVEAPIGRHPKNRLKMAVVPGGKPARTHFKLYKQLEIDGRRCFLLKARLDTGRTHQIRVHLAHLDMPIVGDQLYGTRLSLNVLPHFKRQALHAWRLKLKHPKSGVNMAFEGRLPEDLLALSPELGQSSLK